jgi:hypothetical protein
MLVQDFFRTPPSPDKVAPCAVASASRMALDAMANRLANALLGQVPAIVSSFTRELG